jgi:hypothetical protein
MSGEEYASSHHMSYTLKDPMSGEEYASSHHMSYTLKIR